MPPISRVKVSFRLSGDDLDPTEVSRLLGVEPTRAHAQGDTHSNSQGRVYYRRFGLWLLRGSDDGEASLEEGLIGMLDRLPPDAIVALVERGYKADFFCGLFLDHFNEGVVLSPSTLGRIARLGAELDLDIYSMPNDEENDED